MKILSVIFDHCEINKILKHLVKIGKFPSGLDKSVLNSSIVMYFPYIAIFFLASYLSSLKLSHKDYLTRLSSSNSCRL
jgi:hypothetical protein